MVLPSCSVLYRLLPSQTWSQHPLGDTQSQLPEFTSCPASFPMLLIPQLPQKATSKWHEYQVCVCVWVAEQSKGDSDLPNMVTATMLKAESDFLLWFIQLLFFLGNFTPHRICSVIRMNLDPDIVCVWIFKWVLLSVSRANTYNDRQLSNRHTHEYPVDQMLM